MEEKELNYKEQRAVKKERVYVYLLPHRKKRLREIADQLGMSDSTFLIMTYNYWLQNNNRYLN
jgi:predicted DNA-binding transcriptional regulator